MAYAFVRVDYAAGEMETFGLPLEVVPEAAPAASVVATLSIQETRTSAPMSAVLVEGGPGVARVLVEAAAHRRTFPPSLPVSGKLVGGVVPGVSIDLAALGEAHAVETDRLGASFAYDQVAVLKLLYRMEEGTAPELEIARFVQTATEQDPERMAIIPRVIGYVERRAPRTEPTTVALLEEYVPNEGTAWQHARSELGRAYERVLAQPPDAPRPSVPKETLFELAYMTPPEDHREAVGAYRDWATLLGKRTADLHCALAHSSDPAFELTPYSAMDQRSKYQSARNLIGRVLAGLRRTMHELPNRSRRVGEVLVTVEDKILARFEPILTGRIESKQIRTHGDLHLGRALFTGKNFVILGVGGGRDRRIAERRRKRGALRDVAGMIRSFQYAATMSLLGLRPEDQPRAQPWSWIWQTWISAAFVRGYLDGARGEAFVPNVAMLPILLDAAILEKAFGELRGELERRPDVAWIPMQGILRLVGMEGD
jgi:maltose alpha-D-glucosyltransferase/alpha-amylase